MTWNTHTADTLEDSLADVFDDVSGDDESLPISLPLATRLHRERGCAVVCDCAPKHGDIPAQLNYSNRFWVCAQSPSCGFSIPISETLTARRPDKSGSLLQGATDFFQPAGVAEVTAHPKALSMAAADCNLDLDAMTAQQYSDFRAFMTWWRRDYNTTLSYDIFAEHWPVYTQQRDAQRQAVA